MGASIIAWALGKTGLPQWALELIVVAAAAGAVYAYHIHTFNRGVATEVARVELQNAKTTAQLEGKAATAGALHADEDKDLGEFRTAHPVEPVRLCVAAPSLQTPGAVQISVTTLPSEAMFSRCLREILALKSPKDQISADCSKLLQPAQTK
jgi:hypothetical protein